MVIRSKLADWATHGYLQATVKVRHYQIILSACMRLSSKPSAPAMQIGDASASASPLSFGGFGSMIRHLERLVDGLDDALSSNSLSVPKLQLLQVREAAEPSAFHCQVLHCTFSSC